MENKKVETESVMTPEIYKKNILEIISTTSLFLLRTYAKCWIRLYDGSSFEKIISK